MAAGSTYTKIPNGSVTLGSASTLVTFSSIPTTYTDLILVASIQMSDNTSFYIRCNSDTTNKYSATLMSGDGSTASTERFNQTELGGNGIYTKANTFPTSASFGVGIWNFQNYSNSTTNKTIISRVGSGGLSTRTIVNLYASTSAITQLDIRPFSGTMAAGSTFNLYGIAAA
jgi:hypothetical protein